MSSFLERLLQLIPEAFYDLIGRILPGGIAIASLAAVADVRLRGVSIDANAGALELLLFAVFAYAAGLAISTLAHLIYMLSWFGIFPILRSAGVSGRLTADLRKATKDQNFVLDWNPFSAAAALDCAHDFIKQRSSAERPVVTKLSAEVALLYGVAIATAIVCLTIAGCGKFWLVPIVFLVAGFLRSLRVWYRHQSILSAVINTPDA